MKASIVDLRYKTSDILRALEHNESVTVLYHGKIKEIIKPAREKIMSKVKNYPFFAMNKKSQNTVFRIV